MSSIFNNYNIFRDLPTYIMQNISHFYISRFLSEELGYCVLNDNKVYGLGGVIHNILGYEKSDEKYVLISELCDQNIEEFYLGYDCYFGRNNKNEIFSWGNNQYGLLARGFYCETREFLRPEKIGIFDKINVIHISCGERHCLALSSDGRVYGWGCNRKGPVGCGPIETDFISTPIEIDFNEKIKFIHRSEEMFVLVSFDRNPYIWGEIGDGIDSRKILNPVMVNQFIKIPYILETKYNSHYICLLLFKGIVNNLLENNMEEKYDSEIFLKIYKMYEEMNGKKIIDMSADQRGVACQTEDCVYYCQKSSFGKTSYKTLFEYFLFEKQITYKTIHIKENQLFVLDFKSEENSDLIEESKKNYSIAYSLKQIKATHSLNEFRVSKYLSQILTNNLSLRKFRNSNDLPQILESNVKYYYQSGGYSSDSYFGFFVMNDNRVYCFGDNKFGNMGLGHNDRVYDYTEITELKDKNIQEFYEGFDTIFARNDKNEIFLWGWNWSGQLESENEAKRKDYFKPEKISFFDGKNIIEISCGLYHCLALSANGLIYGWGSNEKGQVGCGKDVLNYITTPILIDIKEKIKFIQCTKNVSFAVSFSENAYFWGQNDSHFIYIPKLIPLQNVLKVYFHYSTQNGRY